MFKDALLTASSTIFIDLSKVCLEYYFFPKLKYRSQPLSFLMPMKLLILHGDVKSYCFE